MKFKEPLKKYFKVGFFEYVVLDSGVYCLEERINNLNTKPYIYGKRST